MKHLENYYRNLCEQLQEKINLLEKKVEEKKKGKGKKGKEKLADKDYDGDGKLETGKKEHAGSVDKAIKRSIAMKKKGGKVISESFIYGGFPRAINEEQHATAAFQDASNQNQNNVATKPNEQEDLYVPGGMGLRYPSSEFKRVWEDQETARTQLDELSKAMTDAKHSAYLQHMAPLQKSSRKIRDQAALSFKYEHPVEQQAKLQQAKARFEAASSAVKAHPHYADFMRGAEVHEKSVRGGNFGE